MACVYFCTEDSEEEEENDEIEVVLNGMMYKKAARKFNKLRTKCEELTGKHWFAMQQAHHWQKKALTLAKENRELKDEHARLGEWLSAKPRESQDEKKSHHQKTRARSPKALHITLSQAKPKSRGQEKKILS